MSLIKRFQKGVEQRTFIGAGASANLSETPSTLLLFATYEEPWPIRRT
jgi:hypothetical protein